MALYKYTSFDGALSDGTPCVEPVRTKRMAAYNHDYMPAIGEFLASLTPEKKCIYIINNAMGASEMWGANRNGDLFPAQPFWGLNHDTDEWGHKTFVRHAHVFRQHKNRLAEGHPSYGRVVFSVFNPRMMRVETVSKVERGHAAIEDIIYDLDRYHPVAVSMGCRIPYDECTLCGHRAPTVPQHCEHLKQRMNEVRPDGLRIGMINYYPIFFDLSFVRRGADASAFAHRKVAEWGQESKEAAVDPVRPEDVPLNAHVKTATEEEDRALFGRPVVQKRADVKASAIYKRVPGGLAEAVAPPQERRLLRHGAMPRLRPVEPGLSRGLMASLASRWPLGAILSTLYAGGIDVRPAEGQYLSLCCGSKKPLADALADAGVVGRPGRPNPETTLPPDCSVGPSRVRPDLMAALADEGVLADRSYGRPFLFARAARLLSGAVPPPDAEPVVDPHHRYDRLMAQLADLNALLRSLLQKVPAEKLWEPLDPDALEQAARRARAMMPEAHDPPKTAGPLRTIGLMGATAPAAYLGAGHAMGKTYRGEELGRVEKAVHDHPFTAAAGTAAAASYGWGKYKNKKRQGAKAKPKPDADAVRKGFGRLLRAGVTKRAADQALLLDIASDPSYDALGPDTLDDLLLSSLA